MEGPTRQTRLNTAGSSLVEMVMVMALFILFGLTIYTLIHAGSNTKAKILAEKEAQIEARIAMSYINVRLKQNDVSGKISIEPTGGPAGQMAIRIAEHGDFFDFETWIFHSDNMLKESWVTPPSDEAGMYKAIAAIDGFSIVEAADGALRCIITYTHGGKPATLESITYLRSAQNN